MTLTALGQLAPLETLGKFELQKILNRERMNYKNLMTDYQMQKAEYKSLQDKFTQLHGQQEHLVSNRQTQEERVQLLLVQGELMDKTRELKELRQWVVTPQQLELLRTQVKQEMNAPVQEKFNKQEETEKYTSMNNKLQYEKTFIKSLTTKFDHQSKEHSQMLKKRRSHYEVKLTCVEREREHLGAQYHGSDPLCDGKGDGAQLREKSPLEFELKKLEKEMADLRAQKDNLDQQAENMQSVQIRQLSEHQAAVKLLEAERQSLRLQVERMESELHLILEQNKQLTKQLHKAERESNSTCEVGSLEKNSHRPEIASVKLGCIPSKGDVARERHIMQGQMGDLQAGMEVLKAAMHQQRHILEKKREMVRRVQAAHGEELCKTVTLHKEKMELNNPFTALEQQRVQQDLADPAKKEELEEHLRGGQQGEESACGEVQGLRSTLQQQSSKLEELEGQKTEIVELQQQYQDNEDQGAQYLEAEAADLSAQNENLGEQFENMHHVQLRELSKSPASVKSQEAVNQSLRLQLEQMESKLDLNKEQNIQLTMQLHKAEKEVNCLSCEIDSLKNRHKIEITDVIRQYICSKEEGERERDTSQVDMKVLKAAEAQLKNIMVKKERETVRREQAASGEESFKTVALLKEKLEMENRLAALEQQMALLGTADHAQKEELEEHLRGAQQGEESACREVQKLKTRLHKQSSQFEELRRTLDRVKEELRTKADEVEWLEEKQKLHQKYSHIKERLQREAEAKQKRETLTKDKEKRLQDKIQLLQAQIEERSSSAKEAKLNKQLKELQQRHNKFRQIILDR
ncbi:centrosomal protein of 83 kDa-like [Pleuronectes platessa]|uniref:centrosomal protein of 83 kDa-like n=1 Tax=Pleuronectes platessa TaxID=8262 RepID=UPI00232A68B2|nr:centrosomal protein of 83 kDa-like [Pleuronectes platessa]